MAKRGTEWSDIQTALLIEHFSDMSNADLVTLIGRNANSISHKARKLKLIKSNAYLASPASGRLQESPIGTEFINYWGYVVRKINNDRPARDRWKAVHIIEWEDHHGPVPEGYMLTFKDGNKMNWDIENLELINRKEGLLRNTIHRYPDEVKAIIRLQKKLERTIRSKENARSAK
jgi:hypothetical protein